MALSLNTLIAAIFGIAVLVGIAQLVPTFTGAIVNASASLSGLGVGGTIGVLILGLLTGLVVAIGLVKLAGGIFGVDLGLG
jgi:hypothetical protein